MSLDSGVPIIKDQKAFKMATRCLHKDFIDLLVVQF